MKIISNNKKAFHEYFIEDTFEAGIVLVGSEVKSIRAGSMSLLESFVRIKDGEVFLKNAYVKLYDKTSSFSPDTRRDRKLLLNKKEIQKISRAIKENGYTLVPIKAYFNNNRVKVQIALARGKKLYDKKETLKEKSQKRDIEQATKHIKQYN